MKINCKRIREIRRQKELSQEYVAFMLGISQSQYSKLESGNKIFEIDKLGMLFDVLEINPLDTIEFSDRQKVLMKGEKLVELIGEELRNINGGSYYRRCWFLLR